MRRIFEETLKIESVERRPDGHRVEIRVPDIAGVPKSIQRLYVRGRAMVVAGLIDTAGGTARQITYAVSTTSVDEIERATRIISEKEDDGPGKVITVHVNTSS